MIIFWKKAFHQSNPILVPISTLLYLLFVKSKNSFGTYQKLKKISPLLVNFFIVSSSAGVGRTGTIIICDICLRMAASEGRLDFLSTLEHIRSQRPNLVDNVEQYKLAHLAVLSCLRGMNTTILCNDDMDAKIHKIFENGTILTQMKYLQDTVWQDEAMKTVAYSCEDLAVFPEKNRSSTIIPG